MSKRIFFMLIVAALIGFGVLYQPETMDSQTTTQTTNLSAAMTIDQNFLSVASETGFANGERIYVDREYMTIVDVDDARGVRVLRGQGGTRATTHASGAFLYEGPADYFSTIGYFGSCTTANNLNMPRIDIATGTIYHCKESRWQGTNLQSLAPNFGYEEIADAAYTGTVNDSYIMVAYATAGRTITLPPITNLAGHRICVTNLDAAVGGGGGTQTITITSTNGQHIGPDRAASLTSTGRGETTCLVSTGMLGVTTNVGWITETAP